MRALVSGLEAQGYFQEWFGYGCVDDGSVAGLAGDDPAGFAFRKTRLDGMWPPSAEWLVWDEDHLLTAVEFLHDHVSKPEQGRNHGWSNCGWHYNQFDRQAGQTLFLQEVNGILRDLDDGFELERSGDVVRASPTGLADLLSVEVPPSDDAYVRVTIEDAVRKYRRRSSSAGDQLDAVRDLAGCLERLRPQLGQVLSRKDEADLFELANRFGIRHSDAGQKVDYDRPIWLEWMFYYYLATLHAVLRLLTDDRHEAVR